MSQYHKPLHLKYCYKSTLPSIEYVTMNKIHEYFRNLMKSF